LENAARLEERLAVARQTAPDEALLESRDLAGQEDRAAHEARARAQQELLAATPTQVRALLENASQVLTQMQQALRNAENDRLELVGQLRVRGEMGLSEQLDTAMAAKNAALAKLDTYQRRAATRKLLFERLRGTRSRIRTAYVEPLTQRVEALGRVVFGPSFEVEIDEQLDIVNRTLGGKTIPLRSLSAGAKEQLSVIVRLACAQVVAPDGGIPLILDDVLGFSDPDRLEAMGAVLAEAGRLAQLIVFTCYPDRYRQVGGAVLRRLP
jgi:hypothetical protein